MEDTMSQDTSGDHSPPQSPAEVSDGIFARRLHALRTAAGLTQQQVASAAGNAMHRSAIAKIEAGDRSVSVGEAVQLARALGVDLAELVTDPAPDSALERAHLARVHAQLLVRALQLEAAERHKLLEEARILYENTTDRLKAAEQRLAELGGEMHPASLVLEQLLAAASVPREPESQGP
jgi:transcriptional regulator with XRE-family HTH domain